MVFLYDFLKMAFIGLDSISAVLLAKEDGILDVKHHFGLKKKDF